VVVVVGEIFIGIFLLIFGTIFAFGAVMVSLLAAIAIIDWIQIQ